MQTSARNPFSISPAPHFAVLCFVVKFIRRMTSSFGNMVRSSTTDLKVLSRYDSDCYGRPRVMSRLEVILHAMAWPAVLGLLIGFGLAISAFSLHYARPAPPANFTHNSAIILEINS